MNSSPWSRVIAHADMDAFFAAVEQLDRPELRGRPVIVGHPGKRGVVATASYEARAFGVGSAMAMVRARRLCPGAEIVRPRFERYEEVSRQVMEVLASFSPLVEALSIDEAFIDLTGCERLFGPPAQAGARIKAEVLRATGLTVSVGVAATKFVAKVASDVNKPNGLTVVEPERTQEFLDALPVRRLFGVGPKTEPTLLAMGLRTIGDVARADEGMLRRRLGALGEHIAHLARGEDPRSVVPEHDTKSIGAEETLEEDVAGFEVLGALLLRLADRVAPRLRHDRVLASGVRVKLKTYDFHVHTRQCVLARPTDSAHELHGAALSLLREFDLDTPMRLVGIAAYQLQGAGVPVQEDLFGHAESRRRARLERTLDGVKERFGDGALRRASELEPTPSGDDEPAGAMVRTRR